MGYSVEIQNLSLAYAKRNTPVMVGVNLSFETGKTYAFLGENGVGKSTLLKAIAGLVPNEEGDILLNDKPLKEWSSNELSKQVAIVLTDSINHSMLSVFDFVAYGRYPFTNWLGKLRKRDIELIEESIALCNASHLSNKSLNNLSDGERQKVMIARAIAQETPIIILDEPTTHLDIRNAKAIFKLLKLLSTKMNKTVLFSTHQLSSALEIADELVIHSPKEVRQISPKDYLLNKELQFLLTGE